MNAILQKWQFEAHLDGTSVILPDGCRDLIRVVDEHCVPTWHYSVLQETVVQVTVSKGARMVGYRLRPGVVVDQELLCSIEDGGDVSESDIDASAKADGAAIEGAEALAQAGSVLEAARACGVSERTLRRVMRSATGKSPAFWLRLGRVRRAALHMAQPLAEVAAGFGFSDQAHMTRECQHWFGVTPRKLRESQELQEQLYYPALATGEQISTR